MRYDTKLLFELPQLLMVVAYVVYKQSENILRFFLVIEFSVIKVLRGIHEKTIEKSL